MQSLTKLIINANLADRVLTEHQLARLVDGSDQRRYNLVNRAINKGELIRVRRGLYVLAAKYRDSACHPFALAQMLVPGSYVSMESALAFHGWIPEAVYTTTSILPGRKSKEYSQEVFGLFTFSPLATHKGYFLELVERIQIDKQSMLLASPIRALMDLVCFKKVEWQGLAWIEQGMRVDNEVWDGVSSADLHSLKYVYKHKRVQVFLNELATILGLDLDHE